MRRGAGLKMAPLTGGQRSAFRKSLLRWYRASARDLPWRRDPAPYRVWLSEMLLQQTRVETALPYFQRIIAEAPDVAALADTPLERLLTLWSGLGYYTRARNLHRAARLIVQERAGELPSRFEDWLSLPGIGRYTAAAIASISQDEPVAALDGNIARVLARLSATRESIDTPRMRDRLWLDAEELLDRASPGDFNQAMMELGARVCRPRRPDCAACPVRRWCAAAEQGIAEELPVRRVKRESPQVIAACALIERSGRWLLVRRPERGLLAGMWEAPGGELAAREANEDALRGHVKRRTGLTLGRLEPLGVVRHVFTHRRLELRVYRGRCSAGARPPLATDATCWVTFAESKELPMAAVDRRALRLVETVGPS